MNENHRQELVSRCVRILEDGELSGEEVYDLSAWLNEHTDVCDEWPGNTLVEPLNNAWANGTINRTELKQIANILRKIVREWNQDTSIESLETAERAVWPALKAFDLTRPYLPSITAGVIERSQSSRDIYYRIDLSSCECDCPDWTKNRGDLPTSHVGRCCKHIAAVLAEIEPSRGWSGWLQAFVQDLAERGAGSRAAEDWFVLRLERSPVLCSTARSSGWASIYAGETRSEYQAFGYSIHERRWAYGMEPVDADVISRAIHGMTLGGGYIDYLKNVISS